MKLLQVGGLFLMVLVMSAGAQEYGRGSLSSERAGLGRGELPRPATPFPFVSGMSGAKISLGWAQMDWDIGPAGGSDSFFAPQGSLFYMVTDHLDINLSGLFVTGKDDDRDLGETSADMARIAIGTRFWFDTNSRLIPFVGGGIGYYIVDGDTDRTREDGEVVRASGISVDDRPGAYVEGGLAFMVADNFFINADLSYDFLLGSADAKINGEKEDFDVSSLSVSLGVTWSF
jgi:outer membrane protein W